MANQSCASNASLRMYSKALPWNALVPARLDSEIWAPGPDGRARPAAPIQAIEDLEAAGYRPDDFGRWSG